MRKTLATALLIAGTTASAYAADLPSRTAPVYAPPPLPFFTWTGGYFGVNAGYAFNNESRFRTSNGTSNELLGGAVVGGNRPISAKTSSDGFTGGAQIGYNYQFGAGNGVVVGLEADAMYTDVDRTNNYLVGGSFTRLHSDTDFLGTVRGRLGYAFDRFLVYGTGGFAYGDVTNKARFFIPGTASTAYFGSQSAIQTGYAYGGGIEYALPTDSFFNFFRSSAVTIKAEYLHYDLGDRTLQSNVTNVGTANGYAGAYTTRVSTEGDLARVGLNYKF